MSILLHAAETWTLFLCDEKKLEAFHMKCQWQILHTQWSHDVTNAEVSTCTSFPPVINFINRCRQSTFLHIARLTHVAPADNDLHCQVNLASGRSLRGDWRHSPGCPHVHWTGQLHNDTGSVCQPLKAGHSVGPPWWSNTTARPGYAITTTTTNLHVQ